MVALYDPDDPDGRVVGTAPRDVMRAENLPHGATAVLVRRSTGEIYVHRRADTKDLWPGRHDCAAGGVLQAGEDPTKRPRGSSLRNSGSRAHSSPRSYGAGTATRIRAISPTPT